MYDLDSASTGWAFAEAEENMIIKSQCTCRSDLTGPVPYTLVSIEEVEEPQGVWEDLEWTWEHDATITLCIPIASL